MEITYILLALAIISLICLVLSPRYVLSQVKETKKNGINEIKFAESQYHKRMTANESLQYSIMRIVTSIFITALGIYGAYASNVPMPIFMTFAFVFILLANLANAFGHLKGFDLVVYFRLGIIFKILAHLCFAVAFSLIKDNGTVCVATFLLGFIVGAIYLKMLIKHFTPVHSLFALANALKFGNLGLAIIALLYEVYAFPILLIIGYVMILGASTMYVVNKKELQFASSALHYLGYIMIALAVNFVY